MRSAGSFMTKQKHERRWTTRRSEFSPSRAVLRALHDGLEPFRVEAIRVDQDDADAQTPETLVEIGGDISRWRAFVRQGHQRW